MAASAPRARTDRRRKRLNRAFAGTTGVLVPDKERGGFHEKIVQGGIRTPDGIKGGRVIYRGYSPPGKTAPHDAIADMLTVSQPDRVRSCARPAGRPRARTRRTASSRAGPSDDPGGEPPPPALAGHHLHLVPDPPPRAILTYACLTAQERGA